MSLTHVLTPLRIGGVEVKNRVVRTAHATALGPMNDDLIAYHLARAIGGVGLSIIEILSVHPTSPAGLNSFDPNLGDRYSALIEAVRPHGMKLFQQVWHGGHNSLPLDGSAPISASDVPGLSVGVVPRPMNRAMIQEIVQAYAETVRKCAAWGLDGAEIHCAHGYLPAQFLSPAFNKRRDEYGGEFENRSRFAMEILRACRAAAPAGFALGVRVAADATMGGVGVEDNRALIERFEAEGLIDFVDVSMGNYHSFPKMIGGMHEPAGYELPTSRPITRATSLPTIVTGRVRTLEEADQIIRDGDADLIGMTRAHIADPDIVRKTMEGRVDEVRPCIACNQGCVGNLLSAKRRMECVVNPGAGFERSLGDDRLEMAAAPRRVLVVGGGPAGMEAARIARLRGHEVVLAEAEPALGGALKLACRAPTRHGFGDLLAWLEAEIYRLGVEVRLSTYVEAEDILSEGFDAVVLATGARPRLDGITTAAPGQPVEGMDLAHVSSSRQLFERSNPAAGGAGPAVVIDDLGHYEALACAEHLVMQGHEVTLVSRHPSVGPLVESALMVEPALQRLDRGEFRTIVRSRAIRIEPDRVVIAPVYAQDSNRPETSLPASRVVVVTAGRPEREEWERLFEIVPDVRFVGDANTPRFLQQVIREGHLAGATV